MGRFLAAACAVMLALAGAARAETVTVFAAASLKSALDQVAADWQAETGNTATLAYDGSAKLAKQIEQGAPADLFVSAAEDWMDEVEAAGLLAPGTRRDILGNRLVLVAHGQADPVAIGPGLDLPGLLGGGKLAMGMVTSVPAGQYGKAALVSLGLWDAVAGQVVEAENVRAALALVALGEAPLGIVYASDAVAESGVSVVGTFPEESHPRIVYPAAALQGAGPAALAFLDYLQSDRAKARFAAQGFLVQ